jgi:hypothetical protein
MRNTVDLKGTSGHDFSLGSTMISWSSRKQGSVAQSTAETEYIADGTSGRRTMWLRRLLSDLLRSELTVIHCDKQSCVKLTENPVFHVRLKHIEMRFHYIQDIDSEESSQPSVCSDSRTDSRLLHQATALDKVCILS